MSDRTHVITPNVIPPRTSFARGSVKGRSRGSARSPAVGGAQKGYGEADDLARRVNVLNVQDTPQNQASLERLKRVLASHQPLRGDVPRGFYLNIRV